MLTTDYPWAELGKATVVDVGSGVGKLSVHSMPTRQNRGFRVQNN